MSNKISPYEPDETNGTITKDTDENEAGQGTSNGASTQKDQDKNKTDAVKKAVAATRAGANAIKKIAGSDDAQNALGDVGDLSEACECDFMKIAKSIFCFCLKQAAKKKNNKEDQETEDGENEEDNGDENIHNDGERDTGTPNNASAPAGTGDNSLKVHFVQATKKEQRPVFTVTIHGNNQELNIKEKDEKTVTISYV